MRITGGTLCGRILRTPRHGVRPTKERVREAVFSSLAGIIPDSAVLDLFAGTGALGMEAWSRGARHVDWVEKHPATFRILTDNVSQICGTAAAQHCFQRDVFDYLKTSLGKSYDFILADPPYDRHDTECKTESLLELLAAGNYVKRNGYLVLEQHVAQKIFEHLNWTVKKNKTYGDTRILFYEYTSPEAHVTTQQK